MIALMIYIPFAAAVLGCIVGLIKGTVNGWQEIATRQHQSVVTQAERRRMIPPLPLEVPEDVRDRIQALEYSCDVTRREIGILESQSMGIYDVTELIKLQKKIAAAYRRLSADYSKINAIKNKYCMY